MDIFIQIASYCDPELIHTIRDCLANADNPQNLKFCIGWQRREEDDSIKEFFNDPRFIILSIPYKDTKGCCWMRHKIQQFYSGEKYTLQLDSHHRFIKGWDTTLIEMFETLQQKCKKPLITAYLPSYNPENDPAERSNEPWKIKYEKTVDGHISTHPSFMKGTEPIPAQFYSGHFTFTLGIFCIEVQHDPNLYFMGEEINIGIRAFTHGYDMFHPHVVIAWHEYTRKNRQKHWDDDEEWWKKDLSSKEHYKKFLENIYSPSREFGIGERSVTEYPNIHLLSENLKEIDETWQNWVKENSELGVDKKTIDDILVKAGFKPSVVSD
jgi:hypothetical protein